MKPLLSSLCILAILCIGCSTNLNAGGFTSKTTITSSSPPIDRIPCESMEGAVLHYHVHLDLFVNGDHLVIPSSVGHSGDCYYWIHTHDVSGILHIESSQKRVFTLQDFYDISKLESHIHKSEYEKPSIWVNGQGPYHDPSLIHLVPHQEIMIVYGSPTPKLITSYKFPGDL